MTTVSVFGGAGFLGGRLVRRLAAEGVTVRVAVRRSKAVGEIVPTYVGRVRTDAR
jgi:uncharacterized protein YbjT (DUF2867 family)